MAVPSTGGSSAVLVPPAPAGGQGFVAALPRKDVLLLTRCGKSCVGQVVVAVNLET